MGNLFKIKATQPYCLQSVSGDLYFDLYSNLPDLRWARQGRAGCGQRSSQEFLHTEVGDRVGICDNIADHLGRSGDIPPGNFCILDLFDGISGYLIGILPL